MKKILILCLLFVTGCMNPPQKTFQIDPDNETYVFNVASVEPVPMTGIFDSAQHIEHKMPTAPEDAVIKWTINHLKATGQGKEKMFVIIHRAEMIQEDKPNPNLFQFDEETYTLTYRLEIQHRTQEQIIKSVPVEGKGFITLNKKASLNAKEKGWAWLIQKMLAHLKNKIQTDFNNV